MDIAVQLFGHLVLTFLSIIVPILLILLSLFREGTIKLKEQYENRKNQSIKQVKELSKSEDLNIKEIEKSIKNVKNVQRTAESKLSLLNPKRQIAFLLLPLLISFIGVLLSFTNFLYFIKIIFIYISIFSFLYFICVLWKLLIIMIEVKEVIDEERKERESKNIMLLTEIVKKENQYFLKDIVVYVDSKDISEGFKIKMSLNEKKELSVYVSNNETRMIKNLEVGFTFTSDFVIEKQTLYSTFTFEGMQIVRYVATILHGDTKLICKPILITPIKKGTYNIPTFLKAENVEVKKYKIDIEVL